MKTALKLNDVRKVDTQQLWIVGCSFSHGLGVSKEERFGSLLSQALNLQVSYLTEPGSSVSWAADQILRSDIRQNDIVVWGLTGASRFPYLDETDTLWHVNLKSFNKINDIKFYFNEKILISNHLMYDVYTKIEQVYNFLNKIGAKFVLAVMPLNGQHHDIKTFEYISKLPYSLMMYNMHGPHEFVDYGRDGAHPGKRQHEIYAKNILNFLGSK